MSYGADPCIKTITGRYYHFLHPQSYEFNLTDLSTGLAHYCRYTGQVRFHYSVAQHTLLLVDWLEGEGHNPLTLMQCLFHDGIEALLGDMSGPLKSLLPEYKKLEKLGEIELFNQFGIEYPPHPAIKEADVAIQWDEKRALQGADETRPWLWPEQGLGVEIIEWHPYYAKAKWLGRYYQLKELCR